MILKDLRVCSRSMLFSVRIWIWSLRCWLRGFFSDSVVKNPPAMQEMQETQVQSLGLEDPLEDGMATQYSCLENAMDRGSWQAVKSIGSQSRTWLKWLSTHIHTVWLNGPFCLPEGHAGSLSIPLSPLWVLSPPVIPLSREKMVSRNRSQEP